MTPEQETEVLSKFEQRLRDGYYSSYEHMRPDLDAFIAAREAQARVEELKAAMAYMLAGTRTRNYVRNRLKALEEKR